MVGSEIIATMVRAADDGHLYRIDKAASSMGFCVDGVLMGEVHGNFGDFEGGLALLPNADPGRALVLVKTNSLDTRNKFTNAVAKGENFFDVARYPEILFVGTGFEWTNASTGRLHGNLTMRGTTRPVTFEVEFTQLLSPKDQIVVTARADVNRTDFGMTGFEKTVSDRVRLCLRVAAQRVTSS
jgi:polyisoprenoid-binding protein YceI